jgi:hypothetical protein
VGRTRFGLSLGGYYYYRRLTARLRREQGNLPYRVSRTVLGITRNAGA